MEQGVWQEIERLYQKFQQLGISEAVDYEKYYLYSLIRINVKTWGILILRINFRQSKQKESSILHSPE